MRGRLRRIVLACAIVSFLICAASADEADIGLWFKTFDGHGAFVVTLSGQIQGQRIEIKSGGDVLDSIIWTSSNPFVKQYVLSPGDYSLKLIGSDKAEALPIRPNEISFLKITRPYAAKPYLELASAPKSVPVKLLSKGEFASFTGVDDWTVLFSAKPVSTASRNISIDVLPPWEVPPTPKSPSTPPGPTIPGK